MIRNRNRRARYWVAPAATATIPVRPVFALISNNFSRRFAAGLFAVHSFVGVPLPKRAAVIDTAPVVVQVRTPLPKVRSVVGRYLKATTAATPRAIVDPTIAAVRTPLARVRSVIGQAVAQGEERYSFPRLVSAQTRIRAPRVRSVIGSPLIRVAVASASSRAKPVASFVRTVRPQTRSFIGSGLARTVVAQTLVRPRPTVVRARRLLPTVRQYIGTRPRVVTTAPPTPKAKAVTALVRVRRPIVRSVVGVSHAAFGSLGSFTFQFAGGPVMTATVTAGGVLVASITGGPTLTGAMTGGPA